MAAPDAGQSFDLVVAPQLKSSRAVLDEVESVLRRSDARIRRGDSSLEARLGSAFWYRMLGMFTPPRLVPITAALSIFEENLIDGGPRIRLNLRTRSAAGPHLFEHPQHRIKTGDRVDDLVRELSQALGADVEQSAGG